MNTYPDSAYVILSKIDKSQLGDDEEKARFSLLMSIALDKNYIDTTTFDVLKPAMDYFLRKGSANDKLRTLYYTGRIFQNRGDDESAMTTFMKAIELKNVAKDSMLLAHTLVAIGSINLKQYKIDKFVDDNLEAAKLYIGIGHNIFATKSYANALGGYVMLENKFMSDSMMSICMRMIHQYPETTAFVYPAYIPYVVEYGDTDELELLLNDCQSVDLQSEDKLDFVRGYTKLCEYDKALSMLSEYTPTGSLLDSLKFLSVKIGLFEKTGDYEQAYMLYKNYSSMMERYQHHLMSDDLLFVEERYRIEMNNLTQLQYRNRIIWMSVCGIFVLTIIVGLLFYRYQRVKSKRILTERENENLKLEQDNLRKEKNLAKLELSKKELESENLRLEKLQLENERDRLNALLKTQSGLSQMSQSVIRTRLSMLNSLLAKEITTIDSYAKPYNKWIDSIKKDKEEFMNSTRLAFKASHPKTMRFLESKGLTVDELNYLCLYALGLRGKDAGEYIQLRRHYNISSEIRKKLGMNEHDSNIGPYVRKLMNDMDS